ncbi:MAG: twin-arginine translocase TatA/TatE family subunit [Solirubrobacteraceae bacterium]
MGLENPLHIAILLIIVLVVFGAKRLPEIGRSLGEGMRGFKDTISGEGSSSQVLPPAQSQTPPPAAAAPPAAPAVPAPVPQPAAAPEQPVAAPLQAPPASEQHPAGK